MAAYKDPRTSLSEAERFSGGAAGSVNHGRKGWRLMDFAYSDRVKEYQERLLRFMEEVVYPAERIYVEQLRESPTRWVVPPVMEEMKAKAKEAGLWNLFLPESDKG